MIQVWLPNTFIPERRYIVDVFFDEFLGLNYQINIYDKQDYEIILENGTAWL